MLENAYWNHNLEKELEWIKPSGKTKSPGLILF